MLFRCLESVAGSRLEYTGEPVALSYQRSDCRKRWSAYAPLGITRGAQPAGDVKSPLSLLASAAWGLTWSAALEHPELRAVCVDLDKASDADEITKLVSELDQDGTEDKVALRGDQRLVARLRRRDPVAAKARPPREPYRLESTGQGTVEGLVVVPSGTARARTRRGRNPRSKRPD